MAGADHPEPLQVPHPSLHGEVTPACPPPAPILRGAGVRGAVRGGRGAVEEAAARAELRLHHPAPGARPHGEVEVVAGVAVHPPPRPVQGRGLVPASLDARLDTG